MSDDFRGTGVDLGGLLYTEMVYLSAADTLIHIPFKHVFTETH